MDAPWTHEWNNHPTSASHPPRSLSCGICLVDHPARDLTENLCNTCATETFQRAIDREDEYPARLGRHKLLDISRWEGRIDAEVINKYKSLGHERATLPIDRVYCTCETFVGSIIKNAPHNLQAIATCTSTSCGKIWCMICGDAMTSDFQQHSGCTFNLRSRLAAKGAAFEGLERGVQYQFCPGCGRTEERSGGCNHMDCPCCGESYCYVCGAVAGDGSAHWDEDGDGRVGGVCPLFTGEEDEEEDGGDGLHYRQFAVAAGHRPEDNQSTSEQEIIQSMRPLHLLPGNNRQRPIAPWLNQPPVMDNPGSPFHFSTRYHRPAVFEEPYRAGVRTMMPPQSPHHRSTEDRLPISPIDAPGRSFSSSPGVYLGFLPYPAARDGDSLPPPRSQHFDRQHAIPPRPFNTNRIDIPLRDPREADAGQHSYEDEASPSPQRERRRHRERSVEFVARRADGASVVDRGTGRMEGTLYAPPGDRRRSRSPLRNASRADADERMREEWRRISRENIALAEGARGGFGGYDPGQLCREHRREPSPRPSFSYDNYLRLHVFARPPSRQLSRGAERNAPPADNRLPSP